MATNIIRNVEASNGYFAKISISTGVNDEDNQADCVEILVGDKLTLWLSEEQRILMIEALEAK